MTTRDPVQPAGRPSTPGGRTIALSLEVEHAGKMRHRVRVRNAELLEHALRTRAEAPVAQLERELERVRAREFVFYSDEPAFLGGDDEHPAPLEYFVAGIGT